jgi:TPP-dependent pyruvate/acetoin dehydrogenase alpha subunit
MRSEDRVALTFFGDGATSRGDWHEALNWAGVDRLPIVFVFENNQFAYSTPTSCQFAVNPIARAEAYGIASVTVDGNDVEAVFEAVRLARERAVAGGGPTMVEAQSMRMHGHGAHDSASYVPRDSLEAWLARDPVAAYSAVCQEQGIDVHAVDAEVGAVVADAVEAALAAPMPDVSDATTDVFCEQDPEVIGPGAALWSGHAEAA